MAFCGNVVDLVEKHKVLDDKEEFVKWKKFDGITHNDSNLQVYIEKCIIPEFKIKDFIKIDLLTYNTLESGEQVALLFIKKEDNVYG